MPAAAPVLGWLGSVGSAAVAPSVIGSGIGSYGLSKALASMDKRPEEQASQQTGIGYSYSPKKRLAELLSAGGAQSNPYYTLPVNYPR